MVINNKITDSVMQIKGYSNIYLLDKRIVIDTGISKEKEEIKKEIWKICHLDEIKTVILTHLHYDHCGNCDLFSEAEFYASSDEIECFKKDPVGTVHKKEIISQIPKLKTMKDGFGLKIINVPGHTRGSICLYYEKEGLLFSGDTYFGKGIIGRTDLPTSVPEKMEESLKIIRTIPYKILCPGHDY